MMNQETDVPMMNQESDIPILVDVADDDEPQDNPTPPLNVAAGDGSQENPPPNPPTPPPRRFNCTDEEIIRRYLEPMIAGNYESDGLVEIEEESDFHQIFRSRRPPFTATASSFLLPNQKVLLLKRGKDSDARYIGTKDNGQWQIETTCKPISVGKTVIGYKSGFRLFFKDALPSGWHIVEYSKKYKERMEVFCIITYNPDEARFLEDAVAPEGEGVAPEGEGVAPEGEGLEEEEEGIEGEVVADTESPATDSTDSTDSAETLSPTF